MGPLQQRVIKPEADLLQLQQPRLRKRRLSQDGNERQRDTPLMPKYVAEEVERLKAIYGATNSHEEEEKEEGGKEKIEVGEPGSRY
jgi:hypothetical protein